MRFLFSVEVFLPAHASFDRIQRIVEDYLSVTIATSSLHEFDGELRYIPIVMPSGMKERYPARSKARVKQKVFDCAPQLDYQTFVSGTFEEQLREYVGGMSVQLDQLLKIGASSAQVQEFRVLLDSTIRRILQESSSGVH